IRPLRAGEPRIVLVWAARKAEGVGVSALQGLDPGNLPSAEDSVQDAALVHELPALPHRQRVGCVGDKAMIAVVAGAGFLQAAVLDRSDAGAVIVVILAVDRLGERIEGAVGETLGPALLYLDGAGVERRMS